MKLLTYLHLSKFKIGDKVKIISLPKSKYCKTNGFKDLICTIEKIELREKFTTGKGSMILKMVGGGYIVSTGIVTKKVKLKLL